MHRVHLSSAVAFLYNQRKFCTVTPQTSGFQSRTERQCRRATCPDKEDTMTLYAIRGDSVTAHSSAPAIVSEGELAVQSIKDIEASGLSKAELTGIWNALPGTAKLAKFKDRKTAAQRLWAAFAGF